MDTLGTALASTATRLALSCYDQSLRSLFTRLLLLEACFPVSGLICLTRTCLGCGAWGCRAGCWCGPRAYVHMGAGAAAPWPPTGKQIGLCSNTPASKPLILQLLVSLGWVRHLSRLFHTLSHAHPGHCTGLLACPLPLPDHSRSNVKDILKYQNIFGFNFCCLPVLCLQFNHRVNELQQSPLSGGMHSKTPSRCLKLGIVLSPTDTLPFPIHTQLW